jgi:hypothetical protein
MQRRDLPATQHADSGAWCAGAAVGRRQRCCQEEGGIDRRLRASSPRSPTLISRIAASRLAWRTSGFSARHRSQRHWQLSGARQLPAFRCAPLRPPACCAHSLPPRRPAPPPPPHSSPRPRRSPARRLLSTSREAPVMERTAALLLERFLRRLASVTWSFLCCFLQRAAGAGARAEMEGCSQDQPCIRARATGGRVRCHAAAACTLLPCRCDGAHADRRRAGCAVLAPPRQRASAAGLAAAAASRCRAAPPRPAAAAAAAAAPSAPPLRQAAAAAATPAARAPTAAPPPPSSPCL